VIRTLSLAIVVAGCSPPPQRAPAVKPPPPPAVVARSPPPAAPRYAKTFDELVAQIERDHVFAPAFARDVGHDWHADLPRLRDELVHARDRAEALVALYHLQNSLRDGHCYLDPPAGMRRDVLRLPVELWSGGTLAAPDVRVVRVADPALAGIAAGDAVAGVDGTPVAAWLAAHPFETRATAPGRALAETVGRIARVELPWSAIRDGDARTLTVIHDGAPHDVALRFGRGGPGGPGGGPDLDHPPAMAQVDCGPIDYGDYALAGVGINACVYLPKRATRPKIAIVHYVSFLYQLDEPGRTLRAVKADHDLLVRDLRGADGVVLDLHENNGGNNPFMFLGWFTTGPWDHPRIVIKVDPALDKSVVERTFFDDRDVAGYEAAQAARQPTYASRFLCNREPCTHVTAPASERVTTAPVALVVGPACASSCDTFALTWSAFKLGPVVGKQPVHAYTVIRLPIPVAGPDREDLGTFRVALSQSEIRDGTSIEGEPIALDWEAPDTFETRGSWVRAAVDEAAKRLGRR
jgi:hypothetical protein